MTPLRLFARFLGFGFQAFGGPVAQIGVLRAHLVDEERWIEPERFRRVLGVYQALPGPEATELCVHFGMLRAGRLGGLLAGLGFMLPGFLLMLGGAAAYVALSGTDGTRSTLIATLSAGAAPAAVVLMARGGTRIAKGALTHPLLIGGAIGAALCEAFGVPFWIGLLLAGALSELRNPRARILPGIAAAGLATAGVVLALGESPELGAPSAGVGLLASAAPSIWFLFGVGLRGGLLTFGGAYTAAPFVRNLVVFPHGFMSDLVFLDGLALGSMLPAPLVIFSTFVGYVGGGIPGAVAATVGMFLPAFAFTLLGFDLIERIVETPRVHALLDGITAGVLGIVAVTVLRFADAAFIEVRAVLAALVAAAIVFGWKSPLATPVGILAAIGVSAAAGAITG